LEPIGIRYFCTAIFKPVKHILHMKKTLLGIIAVFALAICMTSCGEKLLTDEQVQAEIQKGVEAGMGAIESEESAKCDAEFETRVLAEVERLKAEAEATQTVQ
jgi:hypothetical protein